MQTSEKNRSALAGSCVLLLGISVVPGLVCGLVYAASGYSVHEGVGAAYFLPLFVLFFPAVIVAAKCFESAGAYGTESFKCTFVALGMSAALLIAPYLALRAAS